MIKVPTEYEECLVFVEWLERMKLKFSHIPQETYTKSWGVKMKNKRMGVRSGVPDYLIITPKGLIFVEMKRLKQGTVSDSQKEWINAINKCSGVQANVCKGASEAIEFVTRFI
jgi:hypothetical protein